MWSTLTCGINDESVYGGKGKKLGNCKVGKEYIVEEASYYKEALKLRLEGMEGWTSLNNKKGTEALFEQVRACDLAQSFLRNVCRCNSRYSPFLLTFRSL